VSYPPDLHVVTPVFNPRRYNRRYQLYREFEKRVADAGAVLHTVELALGDRPFQVTEYGNPNHLQVRSNDEFFIKENLINLGFRNLPSNVKYMAWVDADVTFMHPDWAKETVEMLQHHPVVQMFSQVINLDPGHGSFQRWYGFAYSFVNGRKYHPIGKSYDTYWHPGFCWAYTRDAITNLGGLLERIPLGSSDAHMASALIGKAVDTIHGKVGKEFHDYVFDWESNAQRWLKFHGQSIGYVNGMIGHYWHGRMKDRQYKERWDILIEHKFDPYVDLRPDLHGLLHFTDRVYGLRMDIQRYLANRNEDCIYFDRSEANI
jgi:hypothetical protein